MPSLPDPGHWDTVYRDKQPEQVSWFQTDPAMSLELIAAASPRTDDPLIDVGAGASVLVDRLLDRGHTHLSVLDVAESGLAAARDRLGTRGAEVEWIVADLLAWKPPRRYALWHDRAVFHFLTESADRDRYRQVLNQALADGGHAVIGTFAADGPQQCSGLPTARYTPDDLAEQFPGLRVLDSRREEHRTPWDAVQPFTWLLLTR
ncbi:hypothetical protein ABH935_004510 [Catenulispora sp. GAS73]|uniref:class I SAM-dependent methyltransferase n=1 Tax=Catenulispora sp. GAS73 TaxID=3156269 RepID=UPI0035191933